MTVSHPWSSNEERVFPGERGIIFTHELAFRECGPQPGREFLWYVQKSDPSIPLFIQDPEIFINLRKYVFLSVVEVLVFYPAALK